MLSKTRVASSDAVGYFHLVVFAMLSVQPGTTARSNRAFIANSALKNCVPCLRANFEQRPNELVGAGLMALRASDNVALFIIRESLASNRILGGWSARYWRLQINSKVAQLNDS